MLPLGSGLQIAVLCAAFPLKALKIRSFIFCKKILSYKIGQILVFGPNSETVRNFSSINLWKLVEICENYVEFKCPVHATPLGQAKSKDAEKSLYKKIQLAKTR